MTDFDLCTDEEEERDLMEEWFDNEHQHWNQIDCLKMMIMLLLDNQGSLEEIKVYLENTDFNNGINSDRIYHLLGEMNDRLHVMR